MKKFFIKFAKLLGYEVIDQNNFSSPTLNKKLNEDLSTLNLKSGGLIYIELPDGETALEKSGPDREEFFVEHFDAYSRKSLKFLLNSVKFKILKIDQVCEPSGKFTLRAFAMPL